MAVTTTTSAEGRWSAHAGTTQEVLDALDDESGNKSVVGITYDSQNNDFVVFIAEN